jgi:ubiquinol-cytochrome c reductase core subunit 2
MLSAVRSPCRRAATKARSFATAVDAAGLKIAAVDNGQPSASVTFLVKAGSRHEPKAGLAHALKNYTFKVRAFPIYQAAEG